MWVGYILRIPGSVYEWNSLTFKIFTAHQHQYTGSVRKDWYCFNITLSLRKKNLTNLVIVL